MKQILILFYVFSVSKLFSQNCKVREDYNPLTDSLCWKIGKEHEFAIFVDKHIPKHTYLNISVITPTKLMTMVGDSAWITLEDGYMIKLRNGKNTKHTSDKIKAVFIDFNYQYITFLAPISHEDLRRLSKTKVKGYLIKLHASMNANSGALNYEKRPVVVAKFTTYEEKNYFIEIKVNKLIPRMRNEILRFATCADKYIQ